MTLVDAFGNKITSKRAITEKYSPGPRFLWGQQPRDLPLFSFEMAKYMLLDQTIKLGLAMRAAPICAADFGYEEQGQWQPGVRADREDVAKFVESQLRKVWQAHIHKLLSAQIWGWAGGEISYKLEEVPGTSKMRVVIDDMLPVHAADCRALAKHGKLAGVRVTGVKRDLAVPGTGYWHAYQPDPRSFYGRGALLGAYSAWADKWLDGGALDVRRLFMHSDAYGGMRIGYPPGTIDIDGKGEDIPNRDVAREIVEQYRAGNVQTFPNVYDANGRPLWTVDQASTPSNPTHILQYPKDLDVEMLRGMEIPDDVLTAEATGSWQGKQVPMQAFYRGLTRWLNQLVADVVLQLLEPLVLWNFGKAEDFHVEAKPLDTQIMEQQQGAAGAQQGPGGPGAPGQPGAPGGAGDMSALMGGGTGEAAAPGPQPGAPPQQMSLATEAAIGQGLFKAHHLVKVARQLMDDQRDPFVIAERNQAYHNQQPADNQSQYASALLMLPEPLASAVCRLGDQIALEDLAEDGLERKPHITVRYGIQTDEAEEIRDVVKHFGPVAVRLGYSSVFEGTDHDVVKLEVESYGIHELHGQITAATPCAETHPTYVPHITLAYVKPGRGKHYAGMQDVAGRVVAFDEIVFSDRSKNHYHIPLTGPVRFAAEKSPKGGVTIKGQFYPGGQWIPSDVIEQASTKDKALLKTAGGQLQRAKQWKESGNVEGHARAIANATKNLKQAGLNDKQIKQVMASMSKEKVAKIAAHAKAKAERPKEGAKPKAEKSGGPSGFPADSAVRQAYGFSNAFREKAVAYQKNLTKEEKDAIEQYTSTDFLVAKRPELGPAWGAVAYCNTHSAKSVKMAMAKVPKDHPSYAMIEKALEYFPGAAGYDTPESKAAWTLIDKAARTLYKDANPEKTGYNYKTLNTNLRKCPKDLKCLSDIERDVYGRIQSVLKKAGKLPEATIVYRGVQQSASSEGKKLIDSLVKAAKSGKNPVVQMNGIVSATGRLRSTEQFANYKKGAVLLEIKAKTGAVLGNLSTQGNKEAELVQAHGTKYRVVGMTTSKGKFYPDQAADYVDTFTFIQLEEV